MNGSDIPREPNISQLKDVLNRSLYHLRYIPYGVVLGSMPSLFCNEVTHLYHASGDFSGWQVVYCPTAPQMHSGSSLVLFIRQEPNLSYHKRDIEIYTDAEE